MLGLQLLLLLSSPAPPQENAPAIVELVLRIKALNDTKDVEAVRSGIGQRALLFEFECPVRFSVSLIVRRGRVRVSDGDRSWKDFLDFKLSDAGGTIHETGYRISEVAVSTPPGSASKVDLKQKSFMQRGDGSRATLGLQPPNDGCSLSPGTYVLEVALRGAVSDLFEGVVSGPPSAQFRIATIDTEQDEIRALGHSISFASRREGVAIDFFETCLRILELDPENSDAYSCLGRLSIQEGRLEEGIRYHGKARDIILDLQGFRNYTGFHPLKPEQVQSRVDRLESRIDQCREILPTIRNRRKPFTIIIRGDRILVVDRK